MNSFYVCIIFTGIMLMIVSLVMIAYDRKKAYDYSAKLSDKKEELEIVISDADQMINEMNKFSDYIVTQMELKNNEITTNLKVFEDKYNQLNNKIIESNIEDVIITDVAVNGSSVENYKIHSKSKDKVIPINNKYKRVIQMSRNGISDTEIAKSLNMGKGEVELILGMNK